MTAIDEDELGAFVVAAHRHGYAASNPDTVDEADGTVIEYREGPWYYRDRYFGSREFLGMEVVHREGRPMWGMHYHGAPTADAVDHEAEYAFLREALAAASTDAPYRGADGFADGERTYRLTVDGSLPRFSGTERIVAEDVVYRGQFAGGTIE